jgi:hypothetical protein
VAPFQQNVLFDVESLATRTNAFCPLKSGEKKSQTSRQPNSSRFPKEPCFSEGSQASPVCPSNKSNMYMKMTLGYWWNDTREN